MPTDTRERAGVALAAIGAVSYGVTVVVGEDLADAGMGAATALGLVYALEATLFFAALERGTAAAAALVFYVYPAMVTAFEMIRGAERAHRTTLVALGMSLIGTATVVAGGGEVSLTPAGALFALSAAAAFAGYLLVGRRQAHGSDPMVVACWVGFGAGIANLARGAAGHQLTNPSSRTTELVLYGAATAIAFTLTFAAMSRIGAARVSVVMTLEAASAVVMAALFLGESVKVGQIVGGVLVLTAAAVIARGQPSEVATAREASPAAGT